MDGLTPAWLWHCVALPVPRQTYSPDYTLLAQYSLYDIVIVQQNLPYCELIDATVLSCNMKKDRSNNGHYQMVSFELKAIDISSEKLQDCSDMPRVSYAWL